MSTKVAEATIMSTKEIEADAKKYFWESIYDESQVSRFKVQMEFTEHGDGERYWRNDWTRAQDPKRVSPATLDRHRETAIAFCFAETATKKKTKVVPSEQDSHLAKASRLYNVDQDGGGCLVWAEDTMETERGDFTYRLNVGDDRLPSERKARERKKSSQRSRRQSKSKSREGNDGAGRSSGGCVSS
jgi:uncharacterized membrane protein YgcG